MSAPRLTPDPEQIRKAITMLFEPGQVVELRVPKTERQGTISGYYDSAEKLAADTLKLAAQGHGGIYWTLQRIKPDLLARSANAYKERAALTTSDSDVEGYRWLPLDFDPVRPSGISASNAEKEQAFALGQRVRQHLIGLGITTALADSGNGYHGLARIDLTAADAPLVARALETLADRFDTPDVKIDRKVFNASRILKAYGTVARKGSDTVDRPHRVAGLIEVPTQWVVVTRGALEEIAGPTSPLASTAVVGAAERSAKQMEAFLSQAKIEHGGRQEYKGGVKWQLKECLFDSQHKSPDSFVSVAASGALNFSCSHNSCKEHKWAEFRKEVQDKYLGGKAFDFDDWQIVIVEADPFSKLKLPPVEQLLDPVIQVRSINELHGWRGTGKTHLALGIAVAVTTGTDFLKWQAPKAVPTLYVDGEMIGAELQQWLAEARAKVLDAGDVLRIYTPDLQDPNAPRLNLANPKHQKKLEQHLSGIGFLVLDNLSSLYSPGAEENSAESAEALNTWLLKLRSQGVTSLFIQHDGKGREQRGTSKREDVLHTVLHLRQPADYHYDEGLRTEVHIEKARSIQGAGAQPFEVELEAGEDGGLEWTIKALGQQRLTEPLVLAALPPAAPGGTAAEIHKKVEDQAKKIGANESEIPNLKMVWIILQALFAQNKVERAGAGRSVNRKDPHRYWLKKAQKVLLFKKDEAPEGEM